MGLPTTILLRTLARLGETVRGERHEVVLGLCYSVVALTGNVLAELGPRAIDGADRARGLVTPVQRDDQALASVMGSGPFPFTLACAAQTRKRLDVIERPCHRIPERKERTAIAMTTRACIEVRPEVSAFGHVRWYAQYGRAQTTRVSDRETAIRYSRICWGYSAPMLIFPLTSVQHPAKVEGGPRGADGSPFAVSLGGR